MLYHVVVPFFSMACSPLTSSMSDWQLLSPWPSQHPLSLSLPPNLFLHYYWSISLLLNESEGALAKTHLHSVQKDYFTLCLDLQPKGHTPSHPPLSLSQGPEHTALSRGSGKDFTGARESQAVWNQLQPSTPQWFWESWLLYTTCTDFTSLPW